MRRCSHSKVWASLGPRTLPLRSRDHLSEAVVRVKDAPTLAEIRNYVDGLATDELTKSDLKWLRKQYRPPSVPLPEVSDKGHRRLLMQIMNSDQQGFSGHQVQPPSGAWAELFNLNQRTARLPTLKLRNADTGSVITRRVVRHALVMTLDIPESVPGALLEMWEVGKNRFDYRVVMPTDRNFKQLDREVKRTENPLWRSGRRWIVT